MPPSEVERRESLIREPSPSPIIVDSKKDDVEDFLDDVERDAMEWKKNNEDLAKVDLDWTEEEAVASGWDPSALYMEEDDLLGIPMLKFTMCGYMWKLRTLVKRISAISHCLSTGSLAFALHSEKSILEVRRNLFQVFSQVHKELGNTIPSLSVLPGSYPSRLSSCPTCYHPFQGPLVYVRNPNTEFVLLQRQRVSKWLTMWQWSVILHYERPPSVGQLFIFRTCCPLLLSSQCYGFKPSLRACLLYGLRLLIVVYFILMCKFIGV
ncbi:PREDICTED: uncharacterized protein LOC104762588 [Camelina sativa]|uniref:Uncharacterized protein LOC104762588 n=1 Tax=Camelina sativa TaxID=90675 RepID=A0ABM0XD98_CAMSA|nr:PREDICTED: uncharacterized protein LOC104762588 [Camelina sativa]